MLHEENPTYTPGSKADWSLIPNHMIGAMRRYIEKGIRPGSFLSAVLSNDLRDAFERADNINCHSMYEYVQFLYSYAPAGCWGSPEKYEAWVKQGGLEGLK